MEPVTGEPRMLIGGKLVDARSGDTYPNINPATEESIGATADGLTEDLDDALAAARGAFDNTEWSRDPPFRRHCREQLKVGLDEVKEELRQMDTAEAGRPIARTTMSIDANISALDGWAALADRYEYERVLPGVRRTSAAQRCLGSDQPTRRHVFSSPTNKRSVRMQSSRGPFTW
jgi:aldehyde dehydrogenase (NAD+)